MVRNTSVVVMIGSMGMIRLRHVGTVVSWVKTGVDLLMIGFAGVIRMADVGTVVSWVKRGVDLLMIGFASVIRMGDVGTVLTRVKAGVDFFDGWGCYTMIGLSAARAVVTLGGPLLTVSIVDDMMSDFPSCVQSLPDDMSEEVWGARQRSYSSNTDAESSASRERNK